MNPVEKVILGIMFTAPLVPMKKMARGLPRYQQAMIHDYYVKRTWLWTQGKLW